MAKRATTKKLNAVTKRLLGHYRAKKEREKKQKENQQELFDLLTELVEETQTLAQKVVDVPEYFWENPEGYVETYFAGWECRTPYWQKDDDGELINVQALIREDPAFIAASWINKPLGIFFAKQVRQGPPMLDDDRLMEENPWLYNDLLESVWQIRPLDDLDVDTIIKLRPYVYRGKPTVALQAPREATQEELADEQ